MPTEQSLTPKILTWKGLKIYSFGKSEVAVVAHGGYTPRRDAFRTGSGKSKSELPIVFYAHPNQAAINCGRMLIEGTSAVKSFETTFKGQEVENYSLKTDPDFEKGISQIANPVMDFMTVGFGTKAHLEDVWAAIRAHGLKYDILHFVACRINKLTFDIDKLVITRND